MSWRRSFRIRLYVRDSLWILPLAGAMLGTVLGLVNVQIDQSAHVPAQFQYSASTATAVLAAIVGAMAAVTALATSWHGSTPRSRSPSGTRWISIGRASPTRRASVGRARGRSTARPSSAAAAQPPSGRRCRIRTGRLAAIGIGSGVRSVEHVSRQR
jgi:hypothetical protein